MKVCEGFYVVCTSMYRVSLERGKAFLRYVRTFERHQSDVWPILADTSLPP
eukprot:SAG25_NODE_7197_length_497_cov_79.605528_1_plen_50_part_10